MKKYWRGRVSFYDKVENWGLTLILGGIGAITYNLIQWTSAIKEESLHKAPWPILLAPFLAGLFAMVLLYIANFRWRQATFILAALGGADSPYDRPGWLCHFLAAMPPFAGFSGSILIKWSRFPTCGSACPLSIYHMIVLWIILLLITQIVYQFRWCRLKKDLERKFPNKSMNHNKQ